jgi:hypothetical protein
MPTTTFVDRAFRSFDPEAVRVMGVVYDMVRTELRCGYTETIADEVIANKIIELAKAGERDPDALCEETLTYFQQHV